MQMTMWKLVSSVFVFALALTVASAAHAITITEAFLAGGMVTVSGNKTAKSVAITWEGVTAAQSTSGGTFTFTTAVVPEDCIGTVSDGLATVDVAIAGCDVVPPPPPPPAFAFPATGQESCWNSDGVSVSCGGTGQDGDTRAGAALSYTPNVDGTITDNNTGLVWEKKTNCSSGAHCVNQIYSWQGALDYVAALNAEPCFAGHCDWRLPNVKELQSLVNYERNWTVVFGPAVSPEFNDCPNNSCTATGGYWSSTSYAVDPRLAWYVEFLDGFVDFIGKGMPFAVRAVRGP